MFKRRQIKLVLFLNGENECICMNKSKVGKVESIENHFFEEPLLDEDGECYNYFLNVCPCLVDYYYKD